jgi:hypothetical protein
MKHKLLSLLILSFVFTSGFAQTTATISVNGVKKGEFNINTDKANNAITVKKADFKNSKQFVVQVQGEYTGMAVYKRTLNIADAKDNVLLSIPEKSAGQFLITDTKIKALIQKGSPVKFFLLMEPANERLMVASKNIYLGTLTAK